MTGAAVIRERRELDALLQLAREMASGTPSTRRVLEQLAETAQEFTQSEGACVLELRDDVYHVVGPSGIALPYDGQSFQIMPAPSIFREVLATGTVVLTNDGQNDPRVDPRFRNALRIRHLAAAPIVLEGRIDGLLVLLNSAQPGGYSASDASLLQRLAEFSAVALRDAHLVQRAERAAADAQARAHEAAIASRRHAVLARTADALANAGTPDAVYQRISNIMSELLGAGGVAIYDVNVDTRTVKLSFQTGIGTMDPETVVRLFWKTRLADVVLAGVPAFVDDMLKGTEVELAVTEPMRRAGIGALALLPLRVDGRVIGSIGIRFLGTREFDAAERAFLESFSSQVAVALRNAQHVSDLQDRAERLDNLAREREIEQQRAEAAADVARTALAHGGLLAGVQSLLGILERIVPSSGKAIGVARARDGRLEYVGAHGSLASLLGHRPAGLRGVLGITPDGLPIELESLRSEAPAPLRDAVPDERALVLPLVARDRALGVLLVSATPDAMWSHTQRETLERVSASLALAIDALLLDEEERQAREREVMLATALTTLDHPVFIVEGNIVRYANPAAAREYGWSTGELIGRPFSDFVASDQPYSGDDLLVSAEHEIEPRDHRHRRRDGSEFAAVLTVSRLRSEAGQTTGAVVSVRDVTRDRAIAEQLRHSEKMIALGELVAGVAHEINNPLTGISAFAELLLEDALSDEHRESVQLIKRESDRATAVIRDLLIFARKADAATGPVDINELVEQTLRLRAYTTRALGVTVDLDLDPSRPHVEGDAQRLQQVLLNLVVNSEQAMHGRETRILSLHTRVDGDQVRVIVGDTGSGMSANVKRRLFEPFFTTKPLGVGTGLGLSVSYGIAQTHRGTLEVQSEENVGTSITLTLPVLPPPDFDPQT